MSASILSKVPNLRVLISFSKPTYETVRNRVNNKHVNPKYRWHRAKKVLKVEIPDFNEDISSMTEEQRRLKLKERGLLPPRPWTERQIYISCTGGVFEEYVPPEGDGKMSSITPGGAKQKLQLLEKKSKSMMAIRKVKSFDEDFDTSKFSDVASEVYIKAHESLVKNDKLSLRQFVTEKAYPEFRSNSLNKTINWKFIKHLETPRVAHARCTDVLSKDNIFGQITVRFHTQQQLAVYDRFGRLMYGSEILAKDVLEYIVFEKHLANMYGTWRIHGKIIPDWMPAKEPIPKSYVVNEILDEPEETKEIVSGTDETVHTPVTT